MIMIILQMNDENDHDQDDMKLVWHPSLIIITEKYVERRRMMIFLVIVSGFDIL